MVCVVAEYSSNYNGWNVEVDGDELGWNHDLVDKLVDYTSDDCDDEGQYHSSFELEIPKFEDIIKQFYPNARIILRDDNFST